MHDGVWKLSLPQEIETLKPSLEDLSKWSVTSGDILISIFQYSKHWFLFSFQFAWEHIQGKPWHCKSCWYISLIYMENTTANYWLKRIYSDWSIDYRTRQDFDICTTAPPSFSSCPWLMLYILLDAFTFLDLTLS